MKTTQENMLSKQQRFNKQFQHNINEPDTINYNQKIVLDENVNWSWSLDTKALLLSLKNSNVLAQKMFKMISILCLSKISCQLFIDNCHLKFSRLIFQIVNCFSPVS